MIYLGVEIMDLKAFFFFFFLAQDIYKKDSVHWGYKFDEST